MLRWETRRRGLPHGRLPAPLPSSRGPSHRHRSNPPREGNPVATMVIVLAALIAGAALWMLGARGPADVVWAAAVLVALIPLGISVARDLMHGETGVDLIALLAMAGSLILGQYLAGAVVGLMLSGGQALERYASSRARRELSALLARAPRDLDLYAVVMRSACKVATSSHRAVRLPLR